jgi:hypothetical protein
MFTRSLTYPYDDGDGLRALAVGTVLTLLSALVLPAVLVLGYSLRVVRAVAAGDESPPGWGDPAALLVDGLRGLVVVALYLAVPAALVGLAVLAVFLPLAEPPTRLVSLLATAVALLSVPLFLAALYLTPAALAVVAVSRSAAAAVSVRRVLGVALTGSYATAWALALLVALVASATTTAVAAGGGSPVSALGAAVVGAVLGFYATVVTAYL